jgi:hypothetical protein
LGVRRAWPGLEMPGSVISGRCRQRPGPRLPCRGACCCQAWGRRWPSRSRGCCVRGLWLRRASRLAIWCTMSWVSCTRAFRPRAEHYQPQGVEQAFVQASEVGAPQPTAGRRQPERVEQAFVQASGPVSSLV